jgi:hypothetical protein
MMHFSMNKVINEFITDTVGDVNIKGMRIALKNKFRVSITADALKERCSKLGKDYV